MPSIIMSNHSSPNEPRQRKHVRFADRRKVKFVLRVVWFNEVVGNLMCEREEPENTVHYPTTT